MVGCCQLIAVLTVPDRYQRLYLAAFFHIDAVLVFVAHTCPPEKLLLIPYLYLHLLL